MLYALPVVGEKRVMYCTVYICNVHIWMFHDVSKNDGTPKPSISIGFSIINHPFWGTLIFGNTHMYECNDVNS